MDAVSMLRNQFDFAHGVLEGTIEETSDEHAHKDLGGATHTIAANYAHAVVAEDLLSSIADGSSPLFMGEWAGRDGISEPPPYPDWTYWGKTVKVDMPKVRAYAQAVYAKTDGIVAGLQPDDLARQVDLSMIGVGSQSIGFLMGLVIGHAMLHSGEISAGKGMQDLRGYQF